MMIIFLVPRAVLALLLTLANWVPRGPNEGRARGACPIASVCLMAAVSWRYYSCSWRKQDVDVTRISPGRAPSGRPIECTIACWVPLGPNKGCMGRLYAFAPGLPTRLCLSFQPGVGAIFLAVGASMTWMPPAFLLGASRQAAPLRAQCRTSF